jgi:hypothetical protein
VNDSPATRCFVAAGVSDPGVLQELATLPLAEIDAICRSVAEQPHSYNPPGLIVALARTGFGAALRRKHDHGARCGRGGRAPALQPARTTSRCELAAPSAGAQAPAASSEWSTLWSAAKQLLAERLPVPEFAAWFDITSLVSYSEGQAIIGVPHVFARDTLSSTYQPLIAEVLQT